MSQVGQVGFDSEEGFEPPGTPWQFSGVKCPLPNPRRLLFPRPPDIYGRWRLVSLGLGTTTLIDGKHSAQDPTQRLVRVGLPPKQPSRCLAVINTEQFYGPLSLGSWDACFLLKGYLGGEDHGRWAGPFPGSGERRETPSTRVTFCTTGYLLQFLAYYPTQWANPTHPLPKVGPPSHKQNRAASR